MEKFKVYTAINNVQGALAKVGISKDRKNQMQNYNFRGIDDIFNSIAPLLAEHKLCILPRLTSRETVERQSNKGGLLFYTTVIVEFDFVSVDDGSKHTIIMAGEAMDSGDKSTNKAMSAAYKYAVMQAFSIPTDGDNDADATSHEVKPVERKPIRVISDEQVEELKQLIADTKSNEEALLKHFNIISVEACPLSYFEPIKNALIKKQGGKNE